jgi:L-alanine-DL-glutamate epimerase-like enolase superfamily enzyme
MAHDHGVRTGKLRLGSDARIDQHRLEQVRTALSRNTTEPTLAIDAGGSWSAQEAIRRIREIEESFDIAWVEGATSSADHAGLKHVSSAISGAVSVGKGLGRLQQFLPHLQHRSADVIELDINVLGITAALQLAEAAFGYELPVTLSAAAGNIHVHLAGVMPSFMSVEILEPAPASHICTSEVQIEDGWAVAGDAPGSGLTVNHAAPTGPAQRPRNAK